MALRVGAQTPRVERAQGFPDQARRSLRCRAAAAEVTTLSSGDESAGPSNREVAFIEALVAAQFEGSWPELQNEHLKKNVADRLEAAHEGYRKYLTAKAISEGIPRASWEDWVDAEAAQEVNMASEPGRQRAWQRRLDALAAAHELERFLAGQEWYALTYYDDPDMPPAQYPHDWACIDDPEEVDLDEEPEHDYTMIDSAQADEEAVAALRCPDFNFAQPTEVWAAEVEKEVGWEFFWENLDFLTPSDPVGVLLDDRTVNNGLPGARRKSRHMKAVCLMHMNRPYHEALDHDDKLTIVTTALDELRLRPGCFVPTMFREDLDKEEELQPYEVEAPADVDHWTLRARREKMLQAQELDIIWQLDQLEQFELDNINLTDLTDMRAHAKLRGIEKLEWTDDEIWDVVTNYGQSVDPWRVRGSPTYFEQNPRATWDWAGQGIDYVEDTEDWLHSIGRLVDPADTSVPIGLRDAMLDSEFEDFDDDAIQAEIDDDEDEDDEEEEEEDDRVAVSEQADDEDDGGTAEDDEDDGDEDEDADVGDEDLDF